MFARQRLKRWDDTVIGEISAIQTITKYSWLPVSRTKKSKKDDRSLYGCSKNALERTVSCLLRSSVRLAEITTGHAGRA
jgi:hypothetical protein